MLPGIISMVLLPETIILRLFQKLKHLYKISLLKN